MGGLVSNDLWASPEWTPMGARVIFHSVHAGQNEGEELSLNRTYHETNLRVRALTGKLWIVLADAADPAGERTSQALSGVIGPDGRWAVKAEPRGESLFAHTIEMDP